MGYPILMEHHTYNRMKFQFGFCILISDEEYRLNYIVYELLLKKIAKTFESLEVKLINIDRLRLCLHEK
jgi:hypothetical protein